MSGPTGDEFSAKQTTAIQLCPAALIKKTSYKCGMCEKVFKNPSSLTVHMCTHKRKYN